MVFKEKNRKNKKKIMKILKEIIITILVALIITMIIRIFVLETFQVDGSSMSPTFTHTDEIFVFKLIFGPVIPVLNLKLPIISKVNRGDIIIFQNPKYVNPSWESELLDFITLGRIKFDWKKNNDKIIIKRILAVAGDYVQIVNNISQKIYINKVMLKRELISKLEDGSSLYKEINNDKEYTIKYHGILPDESIDEYSLSNNIYIPKKGDILEMNKEGTNTIMTVKINGIKMSDRWRRLHCLERIDEETDENLLKFEDDVKIYTIQNDYYFARGDNRDNSRDSTYWGILRQDLIIGVPMIRILPFEKFGVIK